MSKSKSLVILAKVKHRLIPITFLFAEDGDFKKSILSQEKCDELNATFPLRNKKPGTYYHVKSAKGVILVHESDIRFERK
jgi:hypothetical protein